MLNEKQLEVDGVLADGDRNDSAVVIGPTLSSSSCTVPYIDTDQGYVFEGGGMSTLQQLGVAGRGNIDCIGGGGDLGFGASIGRSGSGLGSGIGFGGVGTGGTAGIVGMGGGERGEGGGERSGGNMNKEVRYAPFAASVGPIGTVAPVNLQSLPPPPPPPPPHTISSGLSCACFF